MDLSGGFGDSILSGMMPVLIVVVGRYFLKLSGIRYVPGGWFTLGLVFIFYIGTFLFELLFQTGFLNF